jgi:hypothetical protein
MVQSPALAVAAGAVSRVGSGANASGHEAEIRACNSREERENA